MAGGRPFLVWLYLPAGELIRRLESRRAARDEGKLRDPAAFAKSVLRPPVVEHIAVDATAEPAGQLRDILRSTA